MLIEDKLVDVGFGVLTNLRRAKIDITKIEEVYLSHTHSDHIGDFTGLIWAMQVDGRESPLRVVSSEQVARTVRSVLRLQSTPREFIRYPVRFVTPKDMGVSYCRTIHEPQNLAFRFRLDGADVVYTGDTAPSKAVADLAEGCDILIHDATFLNSQKKLATITNHSTGREAARTAARCRARRLVMTHIFPWNEKAEASYLEEARSEFQGEATVATDMMEIRV